MELTTTLKLKKILNAANIAEHLTEKELSDIGIEVVRDFETDLGSRSEWEKRNEDAMKLALQIKETKSFPWQGASNVKFPLITIAALQYHARAYPTLLGSDTPVKCKVNGEDKDGTLTAKASRIENHMSYQILEQDEDWESEMDKVLITQPILGCAFKKTFFDSIKNRVDSDYIIPKDLVVNYWAKSLDSAPRITHVLYMSKNDVYERVVRGLWSDMNDKMPGEPLSDGLKHTQDKSQGLQAPPTQDSSTPFEILEQHRFFDLDGDGYEEPYICFVRRDTKQVLRIVARFFEDGVEKNKEGKIVTIKAEQYFTKFPFIPSPDGGFYDLGFGVLLGPLNESINTLINQLIDAGTMANTAGGFLSRGIKLRGGNYSFAPLEWKHVESTGDDLRKGIMPLPVREPSNVLFTLLNLLINYGERIGISVDILTGQNPGQNTPAETSRTMAEQGMKIFSGIFKRTHRSLRDEFRKQYRLNQLYITEDTYFTDARDNDGSVLPTDYVGVSSSIRPAADPHIISDSQRIMQAEALRNAAMTAPGFDMYQVNKRYLQALKIPALEQVLPDPKGPNAIQSGPSEKVQIEQMKQEAKMQEVQMNLKLEIMRLTEEANLNQAKITELQANATLLMEQAKDVGATSEMELVKANLQAAKQQHEVHKHHIDSMIKMSELMEARKEAKAATSKGE